MRFFSDTMRVPAALIGSAALGMLFLPPTKFAWSKEEYHHYQMFDFLYRVPWYFIAFFTLFRTFSECS